MAQFLVRRVLQVLLTLVLASMFTFVMLRLVPGDVADVLAVEGALSEEAKLEIRAEQGLDDPVVIQYLDWVKRLLQGDFGHSYWTQRPVEDLLAHAFPKTAQLALVAMAIAIAVGVPLGALAGAYRGSVFDYLATLISMLMVSVPTFAVGIIALLVVAVQLQWLPATGSLVLPAIVLGIDIAGTLVRTLRSDVRNELSSDYVRTAMAKGLPRMVVLRRHVLPNSLTATITVMGLALGNLLGGAIIIESVFHWPGIGSLLIESIRNRDYPVVEAVVMVMTAGFVVANLAVDALYARVDPRVRV